MVLMMFSIALLLDVSRVLECRKVVLIPASNKNLIPDEVL